MQLRMQNAETLSPEQIQTFLRGSEAIEFQGQNRADLYGWVQARLGGPGVCHARQEAAGNGAGLHRQDDGIEPATGDTISRQVPGRGSRRGGAIPAAALSG